MASQLPPSIRNTGMERSERGVTMRVPFRAIRPSPTVSWSVERLRTVKPLMSRNDMEAISIVMVPPSISSPSLRMSSPSNTIFPKLTPWERVSAPSLRNMKRESEIRRSRKASLVELFCLVVSLPSREMSCAMLSSPSRGV